MPRFFKATKDQITEVLPEWYREILEIDQRILTNEQLDQILDAEFMVTSIMEQPKTKLRGVVDIAGKVKAIASVSFYPDSICMEYIVTTPKSLHLMQNLKRVRGAATALIVCLVRESLNLGFDGRIKANSVESAIDFYRDLGFIEKVGVVLLPAAAQKLLTNYGELI
jgi:hypothetical protein